MSFCEKINSFGNIFDVKRKILPCFKRKQEKIRETFLWISEFMKTCQEHVINGITKGQIISKCSSETPHCPKSWGASSNMAGIICPLGPNRLNWYPKTWGGTLPPPLTSSVSVLLVSSFWPKNQWNFLKDFCPSL